MTAGGKGASLLTSLGVSPDGGLMHGGLVWGG
eukprot:CAMPEP_0183548108 /NCGR_PEP_ID=MMETSP0371-20130417/57916_1 /TAXON_ID=268820 /ORGANISM="Peridinium aciculiferum, Strain PAER-2" /LENGTH=31 /DNA_ID= /DNA_START= /DNA_END= /DNA_ORIENTATION=